MRRGSPWGAMSRPASFAADPRVKCGRGPPRAGSAAQEPADHVDEQPGEAADHRPVDPDELEIATDLQLDAPRRLGRIPPRDGRGDELADLVPRLLGELAGGRDHPLVDLALQRLVVAQ